MFLPFLSPILVCLPYMILSFLCLSFWSASKWFANNTFRCLTASLNCLMQFMSIIVSVMLGMSKLTQLVRQKNFSVTECMCEVFCQSCATCNVKQTSIKPHKGGSKSCHTFFWVSWPFSDWSYWYAIIEEKKYIWRDAGLDPHCEESRDGTHLPMFYSQENTKICCIWAI